MPDTSMSSKERFAYIMHLVPGGAMLFALVPLVVCGYLGWYFYGSRQLDQALYSLRLEQIQITQQPDWILTSVAAEVYNDHRLDRINLLDPSASASIAAAFETHPWVEKTVRVQKTQGLGVHVDVIYRKPLAMIQVHYYPTDDQGKLLAEKKEGYYPVDRKGVILPVSDFKKNQASVWNYPIIEIDNMEQAVAQPGLAFNDLRIHEALRLIDFLERQTNFKQLGIQWVRVRREDSPSNASPWILEIWTTDRRMVIWGRAPGEEATGENTADRKWKALLGWLDSQRQSASSADTLNLLDGKSTFTSTQL